MRRLSPHLVGEWRGIQYPNRMTLQKITCIIPARNEAGRLKKTIEEVRSIESIEDVIIVEGGSTDNTFEVAKGLSQEDPLIRVHKQFGKGKFDAVKQGVEEVKTKYFIVWDADGTVSPRDNERIIRFALDHDGTAIGDRLKGNRHKGSMRFANLIGNYLFAALWSPFLRGEIADLLCGTKVVLKADFDAIPQWVLSRDPFGDFSIVASAIVGKKKPISVSVDYLAREYGDTNIRRWSSGLRLIYCSFVCFVWVFMARIENQAKKVLKGIHVRRR